MTGKQGLKRLEPFIGEWSLEMVMPGQDAMPDIGARVSFEWTSGRRRLTSVSTTSESGCETVDEIDFHS